MSTKWTLTLFIMLPIVVLLVSHVPTTAQQSTPAPATEQRPPLPEGYIRNVQPAAEPAKGNTSSALASTGKVYQVGFRTGDEVMSGLVAWAEKNKVTSGYITGIGGFVSATFGWVDPQVRGGMRRIDVGEKVEVVSFAGNFTPTSDGKVNIHIHALVTGGDGVARGGHLITGQVGPIMEIYVTELAPPGTLPLPQDR